MLRRILTLSFVLTAILASAASSSRADYLLEADYGSNTINRIDSSGNVSAFITTNLDQPIGLAIGAGGNIYVANNGTANAATTDTVSEYSSNGVFIRSIGGSAQLSAPQGIAIDSAGNVYVSNAGDGSFIDKFSSTGTLLAVYDSSIRTTGLSNPFGLAVDSSNNLYVANNGNGTVEKIDSVTGAVLGSITGLDGPSGLAIGPNGNLYVSTYAQTSGIDTITEYNSSLTAIAQIANTSTDPNLNAPIGMAFQSGTGTLFVANDTSNTIETSPGPGSSIFATGLDRPTFIAFQTTAVPEPTSFALMAIGITGLLTYTRFRGVSRSGMA